MDEEQIRNAVQRFKFDRFDPAQEKWEYYIQRFETESGADPGFWERGGLINIVKTGGGYGRGRAPSRDSKGVLGER